MDRIDISILRWFMQGQPTAPLRPEVRPMIRSLSNHLGVTGETVRNRMRRMFETGVLGAVTLQPNPSVLGTSMGALGMYVPATVSRPELIRKIALIEGCQLSVSHHDGLIGVIFMHQGGDSLRKKTELISRIAGVSDAFYTEVLFPPCRAELSATDWAIAAALRPDASLSFKELSAKLGLSTRTVKRRLTKMVAEHAVFSVVSHEVRAVKGALEANMVVFYDPSVKRSETDQRILRELDELIIYAGIWARYSVYAIAIPNLASMQEAETKVRRLRGVKEARASIIDERLELYDSLDGMIARKLGEAKRMQRRLRNSGKAERKGRL